MDQVSTARDGTSALAARRDGGADIVLMDMGLPDQSGLTPGKALLQEFPEVNVLAVTTLSDQRLLHEAMRAGFARYLTKDTSVSRLGNAIRMAADGEVVIPQKLARVVTGPSREIDSLAALLADQLTEQEREALVLLTEGSSTDEIADRMGISRNTVRTHVQNILSKLGLHSRLEAAAFAVRHELMNLRGLSADHMSARPTHRT